jgi:hypothetical protein
MTFARAFEDYKSPADMEARERRLERIERELNCAPRVRPWFYWTLVAVLWLSAIAMVIR